MLFLDKCLERFTKELLKEWHMLYEKKHIISAKRENQIAFIIYIISDDVESGKRRETFM